MWLTMMVLHYAHSRRRISFLMHEIFNSHSRKLENCGPQMMKTVQCLKQCKIISDDNYL